MSRRLLKLTLSALLLAASATSYAEDATTTGPVTLKDGTATSWAAFVDALNNPPTVTDAKGKVADLPNNNSAKVNYEAAVKKVANDSTDLEAKRAAVAYDPNAALADQPKLVADSLKAESQLSKAESALDTYIKENVTAKKEAYENAEADLATWTTQLTGYNNDVTRYSGQVTSLTAQLDDAKDEQAAAQKAYDDAGTTTQTTETTYVPWLQPMITAAKNLKTAYTNSLRGVNGNINIYYKILKIDVGDNQYDYFIDISFADPKEEGWTNVTKFNDLKSVVNRTTDPLNLEASSVYLGQNLKNFDNVDQDPEMLFEASNLGTFVNNACAVITNLSTEKGYSKTTVHTETTYDDPDDKLYKALEAAKTKVSTLTTQRRTANENLTTANNNVAETQAKIDGYTKVPAGSPEGTLSQQAQLKKAYEDADAAQADSDAAKAVTSAEAAVDAANKAIAAARAAVTTAEQKFNDDKEALATAATLAQAEADVAANTAATATLRDKYTKITLTGDVTVTEPIDEFNGIFNGGDNIITVESGVLFTTFNGTLSDVAINGKTFTNRGNNATFTNVARWDSKVTTDPGVFYGDGTSNTYATLGELGFAARAKFGVSFVDNAIVDKADETTVYKINKYSGASKLAAQYVTVDGDKFISATDLNGSALADNQFALSETYDLKGFANVFYPNNSCDNVVITDKTNFFCPVDLTAANVTYNRVFTKGTDTYGINAMCLPFAIPEGFAGDGKNIRSISTFDEITTSSQDPSKKNFKFTAQDEIPANTPVLVLTKPGVQVNEIKLSNTAVSIPTTVNQISTLEGTTGDNVVSFGTLKNVTAGQINSDANADYIYALNSNGAFKAVNNSTTTVPAFRMVISTLAPVYGKAPMRAPAERIEEYGIEVYDEEGNVIFGEGKTSGIESVATDAASFNVTTAQGQIIIESEADYGKVEIYSVDGRLAAVANVTVGTTTVDVNAGVYIVMGKKVLVK